VQAAKLAQAPFLSSISFGAAKEIDSAGRATKKAEGTPVTALLFHRPKGGLFSSNPTKKSLFTSGDSPIPLTFTPPFLSFL